MAKINIFGKKEAPRALITDFIYEFVSKSKRSKEYKRHYRNVARHVDNFQRHTGIMLYTDNVTELIAEEFIQYLKSVPAVRGRKEPGLMGNTIAHTWQKLQHMLRKAAQRGYKVNFDHEVVILKNEDTNAIYLTLDELRRINELKTLSVEARAVRDRFLLGCFTALRFSDYSQITKRNIIGKNIEVKTRKTGKKVVIPIHPIVLQILERNKGEFPPLPSQQAFGAAIKRVCRKAEIAEPILFERTIGTKIVRNRLAKYEMVSSHTARRTGATNMYLAGIPTARIMLITGHQTEESFFRYIRIGREENAKTLAEHAFFK